MTRRISAEGLAHLKRWEGVKLTAYRDIAGVLTIGYGSTGPHVREGMTITETQAESLLLADLERFEAAVERLVKVPLSDERFAALVSLAFNIGEGAFAKSTLLKVLNAGRYDDVPAQIMRWNKVKGQVVDGLTNRRAAECGLWAKGAFVASNTVVPTPPKPKPATLDAGVIATTAGSIAGVVVAGKAVVDAAADAQSAAVPILGVYAPIFGAVVMLVAFAVIGWRVHQRRQGEAA